MLKIFHKSIIYSSVHSETSLEQNQKTIYRVAESQSDVAPFIIVNKGQVIIFIHELATIYLFEIDL
jgi:hypothetical protein